MPLYIESPVWYCEKKFSISEYVFRRVVTTALSKSSMFAQEKLTSLFPKIFSFKFYRMLKSKIDLFQFYLPKDWLIRDVRSFQKNKANFYSHIFIVQGRAKIL